MINSEDLTLVTFRWVACQIDYLCELNNDRERREALDSLPPTLSETYERILTRVNTSNSSNQRIVQRALRWIAYAREPLSLSALAEAISLEVGDNYLDPEAIVDTSAIIKWCSSLVQLSSNIITRIYTCYSRKRLNGEVYRDDSIIEFAHFTVKEFLLGIDSDSFDGFQAYSLKKRDSIEVELARNCLTYLSLDNLAGQYPRNGEEQSALKIQHPFYSYAAICWTEHAKDHFHDEAILTLSCQLFHLSKSNKFICWSLHLAKWRGAKDNLKCLVDSSPLHWACLINAPEICRQLIKEGSDINKESHLGRPLQCAIAGTSIFHLVVSRSVQNFERYSRLQRRLSSIPLLKLLLEAGANLEVSFSSSFDATVSLMRLALLFLADEDCAYLLSKGAILDRRTLDLC